MSDVAEPQDPYEIALAPPARRAITSKLLPAVAAVDFITGTLPGNPKRLGKPLHAPLEGIRSARLMRDWAYFTKSTTTSMRSWSRTSVTAETRTGGDEAKGVSHPGPLRCRT
jgi:hypothetical protein